MVITKKNFNYHSCVYKLVYVIFFFIPITAVKQLNHFQNQIKPVLLIKNCKTKNVFTYKCFSHIDLHIKNI